MLSAKSNHNMTTIGPNEVLKGGKKCPHPSCESTKIGGRVVASRGKITTVS